MRHFFTCGCGCGTVSDNLGKDYIKLKAEQRWFNKNCTKEQGRSFKNGVIITEKEQIK